MLGPSAAQSYHGQTAALLFPLLWNLKSRDGEAARASLPGPQRAGAAGPEKGGVLETSLPGTCGSTSAPEH